MSAPEYSLLMGVLAGTCGFAAAFAQQAGNSKRAVTLIAVVGALMGFIAVGVYSI
jgi:hypothetical protein